MLMYVRPCVRPARKCVHFSDTAGIRIPVRTEGEARPVWRAKPDLLRAKPDQTTSYAPSLKSAPGH